MDVLKINNNYKVLENSGPEILSKKDQNDRDQTFSYSEEETTTDFKEDVQNAFLNSYLKDSDNFTVSTNEWLGTWRPLTN